MSPKRLPVRRHPTLPALEAARETAEAYAKGSRAASTWRAYESDWRKFLAWCRSVDRESLPAEHYMYPQDPGSCTGSLCPGGDLSFGAVFGWTINSTPGINFGTLVFTMDSTTYAVTVTTTPALITTDGDRFIGNGTESTSVTGSVVSPTSPPSAATPAGIGKPASKFSPQ
jgi:hypothetical protein